MPASVPLYFRPIDTFIKEVSRENDIVLYQIVTNVNFYTDELMTNLAYSKQYTFNDVPYNETWDGILGEIYGLIIQNV